MIFFDNMKLSDIYGLNTQDYKNMPIEEACFSNKLVCFLVLEDIDFVSGLLEKNVSTLSDSAYMTVDFLEEIKNFCISLKEDQSGAKVLKNDKLNEENTIVADTVPAEENTVVAEVVTEEKNDIIARVVSGEENTIIARVVPEEENIIITRVVSKEENNIITGVTSEEESTIISRVVPVEEDAIISEEVTVDHNATTVEEVTLVSTPEIAQSLYDIRNENEITVDNECSIDFVDDELYCVIFDINSEDYSDFDISKLDLSTGIINGLMSKHIDTVEDLLNISPVMLKEIDGIGKAELEEVNAFCTRLGGNECATKQKTMSEKSLFIDEMKEESEQRRKTFYVNSSHDYDEDNDNDNHNNNADNDNGDYSRKTSADLPTVAQSEKIEEITDIETERQFLQFIKKMSQSTSESVSENAVPVQKDTTETEKTISGKKISHLYLSKSLYCNAVQCPKMLWLAKNHPEYYDDSSMDEGRIEDGKNVGELAKGLFDRAVTVEYNPEKSIMIHNTKRLIGCGTKVICEAAFMCENLYCAVDILVNHGNNNVEIYEVKSSTKIKDIHYDDVAYQVYVLNKCGYNVIKAHIVHIDNTYIRHGELDIEALFCVADVTSDVLDMQPQVEKRIEYLEEMMSESDEPNFDICCDCFSPYQCGYWKYCSRTLPQPNVFDLSGKELPTKKKVELYSKGVVSFEQLYTSSALSKGARVQVEAEVENKSFINKPAISAFLSELSYPIYFLDFETINFAIPQYDDTKPYMQIPFQYSLHYIEHEGGELKHKEYLAEHGKDPRRELAEKLCNDIPMNVCVTAYNMSFEKTRIKELAELYPDLSEHLMNIHDHIYDLMIPFSQKNFYLKEMQGSYSIKYVLPAFYPEDPTLDYTNLVGVHNGKEASNSFALLADMDEEERELTRNSLLKYCELDTFAMVKVWEKLKEEI